MNTTKKHDLSLAARPRYFDKKGEVNELRTLLRSVANERDQNKKREAIKASKKWVSEHYFNNFLFVMETCDSMRKAMDDERYALGKALLKVGNLIAEHKDSEKFSINISTKDILRKVINFIQFSKDNNVGEPIIIRCL